MKTFIISILLAATSGVLTAQQAGNLKYTALAVDRSNGFYYGFSFDYPSLSEAETKALDECRKKGGDCQVVASASGNGCIAYRTVDAGEGTAYGWGIAADRESADAIAREECLKRSNGKIPANFAWACNSGEETLKVIRNDSAPSGGNKHRLTDMNGEVYDYEGTLRDGKPHGPGTSVYVKSGNIYKGNYINGQIEGEGEAIYKSGDHYIGGMSKGKFSGYGVYKFRSGNKYEGNFVNSQKHGKGKQSDADGSYYEGDFVKGLMHGYGKFVNSAGTLVFEGKMENDDPVRN